ncbi:titin homolog [Leptopilina boulardi]|uniref:titin homolog n=1 Tax=Leptopilina boulardi TaxID=63433 RepID=UPI0021F58D2F|nr:titin homolog [Leptopilina boulardi]
MAANALEEKINKIRLQNEEIKRRYEEVEADKKNAAKLNALVKMVPSSDWPERKEPPEFTRKETNKSNVKSKSIKEHSDRPQQYVIGGVEGKKIHKFAQGDGPPPDPKYNFLADSEREENNVDIKKDEDNHKAPNKYVRNGPRKRGGGRDGYQKDHRKVPPTSRDGYLPEYDAWRAERNRIDEARINRQRTAEGNWRREWDNDKINIEKESSKKDPRFSLGDTSRRDYKEFEKRHQFEVEHSSRGRGGNHRGSHGPRTHGHYDNQNDFSESLVKGPLSPNDDRTVIATDKNIKVTVNHGNMPVKGPVMSVKVNAPSIAGTGRVGPRQKSRVTYSSHAESEISTHQIDNFYRQKSFDEKMHFNNTQRTNTPKSPFATRRKDNNKSPYLQRKDVKRDEATISAKSPSAQKKKFKEQQKSPQGQMQFFTSTSRGRGQTRFNGAKNTVIKILGRTDNSNLESTNVDVVKSNEYDIQQFSQTHVNENLKNNEPQIIIDNFTIIEAENSIDDIKEAIVQDFNCDTQNESLEEKFEKNEEIEVKKIDEMEITKNKETEENVVLKEIQVLEKNEKLENSKKAELLEKCEVLEKSEILKTDEVLEKNETEKIDIENIEGKEEIEIKIETIKSEEKEIEKSETVKIETEELEIDKMESEERKEEKIDSKESKIEKIESEERNVEKIEPEERKEEKVDKEIEKIESEERNEEKIEPEERKKEILEHGEKEIEKIESEERIVEKIEPEERKEEKIEPEDKEREKIDLKETKIEKIESEERKIERDERKEEKIDKEIENIEPKERKTEKFEPETKKNEPDAKEIEKNEVSQKEETPKNEIVDQHPLVDTNKKLSENVLNINESISAKNIFSKIENCSSENNETKIEDQQITLKSEIIENFKSVEENTRELEIKSDDNTLKTVSTEIPNEASYIPSE